MHKDYGDNEKLRILELLTITKKLSIKSITEYNISEMLKDKIIKINEKIQKIDTEIREDLLNC